MRTTALLMMVMLGLSAQAAAQTSTGQTSDGTLPVSLDRIKKALTVEAPAATPIQAKVETEDGVPKFSTRTESPRTLVLRSYLDDGTAVPAYVRAPFDPYHYEFLDMVTPDAVKGCAQFDEQACLTSTGGQVISGLMWQRFASEGVGSALRQIFRSQGR